MLCESSAWEFSAPPGRRWSGAASHAARLCEARQRRREGGGGVGGACVERGRVSFHGGRENESNRVRGDKIPAPLFHIFKSLEKKHLKKTCDSKNLSGCEKSKKKRKKSSLQIGSQTFI